MDLHLSLKRKWFEQIEAGIKPFEYRLNTPYWQKRIIGKTFDRIIFTWGYPKAGDLARRIEKPWLGYEMQTIISEEWGDKPQYVFAIRIVP